MVHKEKIARREIGALATSNKNMARQMPALPPPHQERATRYVRCPIEYTMYDDLGHGQKIQPQNHYGGGGGRHVRKSNSSVTDGTASISSATGPNTNYDTSAIYRKTGTLNPGMTGTLTRNQARNLGTGAELERVFFILRLIDDWLLNVFRWLSDTDSSAAPSGSSHRCAHKSIWTRSYGQRGSS